MINISLNTGMSLKNMHQLHILTHNNKDLPSSATLWTNGTFSAQLLVRLEEQINHQDVVDGSTREHEVKRNVKNEQYESQAAV